VRAVGGGIRITVGPLGCLDVVLALVEADPIAGRQVLALLEAFTIDIGAVGGPEVLHHEAPRLQPQPGVAAGYVALLDAQIGLLAAADYDVPCDDEGLVLAQADQMPAAAICHSRSRTGGRRPRKTNPRRPPRGAPAPVRNR
jgi:hypothetical protein